MTTGTQPDFGIVWSASLARAPADQVAEWLAFAQAICDEADGIALQHFRRELDLTSILGRGAESAFKMLILADQAGKAIEQIDMRSVSC